MKSCKDCKYYRGWKLFVLEPMMHEAICSRLGTIATVEAQDPAASDYVLERLGDICGLYRKRKYLCRKNAKNDLDNC